VGSGWLGSLRARGGLELRRLLLLTTAPALRSAPPARPFSPPRTTSRSMSTGVMAEGSSIGFGRFGEFAPASDPTSEVHCFGRPTNFPLFESKPV
jgi:hypothetical protein